MTKSLFTAILLATMATGCTKLPATVRIQAEPERTVKYNARPKPQAAPTARPLDPFRVDHGLPIIASGSGVGLAEQPALAATPPVAEKARMEIIARPTAAYRILPAIEAAEDGDRIIGAVFSPKQAVATWTVKASQGSPVIGKVKLTLTGDKPDSGKTFEASAKELGWPLRIDGQQDLSVPLDSRNVLAFLQTNVDTKAVTLDIALENSNGEPLQTPADEPFALSVKLDVL